MTAVAVHDARPTRWDLLRERLERGWRPRAAAPHDVSCDTALVTRATDAER